MQIHKQYQAGHNSFSLLMHTNSLLHANTLAHLYLSHTQTIRLTHTIGMHTHMRYLTRKEILKCQILCLNAGWAIENKGWAYKVQMFWWAVQTLSPFLGVWGKVSGVLHLLWVWGG